METNERNVTFPARTQNERAAWQSIADFLHGCYQDNPEDYEDETGIANEWAERLSLRIERQVKEDRSVTLRGNEVTLVECATDYLRDEYDTEDDWRYAIDAKQRGEVTRQANLQAILAGIWAQVRS